MCLVIGWAGNIFGNFNLESTAYLMGMEFRQWLSQGVSSSAMSSSLGQVLVSSIWKLNVPNDVELFSWRACLMVFSDKVKFDQMWPLS